VAPATTWGRKRRLCIIVKTIDYHYDIYFLNFNCHCFAVLSCCMRPGLEVPHPGRQTKHVLYKKVIYYSVN
jgi:hypothetical protein